MLRARNLCMSKQASLLVSGTAKQGGSYLIQANRSILLNTQKIFMLIRHMIYNILLFPRNINAVQNMAKHPFLRIRGILYKFQPYCFSCVMFACR